jgi:hypothetical protein
MLVAGRANKEIGSPLGIVGERGPRRHGLRDCACECFWPCAGIQRLLGQ